MGKSSLFRGVTLFRPTGKWRAQVIVPMLPDMAVMGTISPDDGHGGLAGALRTVLDCLLCPCVLAHSEAASLGLEAFVHTYAPGWLPDRR